MSFVFADVDKEMRHSLQMYALYKYPQGLLKTHMRTWLLPSPNSQARSTL